MKTKKARAQRKIIEFFSQRKEAGKVRPAINAEEGRKKRDKSKGRHKGGNLQRFRKNLVSFIVCGRMPPRPLYFLSLFVYLDHLDSPRKPIFRGFKV
jgi:hypothetical protein